MAKYRLTKEHYLQDNKRGIEPRLHPAGSTIDWPGTPSMAMEGVDKPGIERVGARRADFAEKRKANAEKRALKGWSPQFEANMARILTTSTDENASPQAAAGSGRTKRKAA